MKKLKVSIIWVVSLIMVLQIVLPTVSYAVETVKLNIQKERPYNDDDGDGTVGNDVYNAHQDVFKIGEQTGSNENSPILNFSNKSYAYYCLRGLIGFGSGNKIHQDGLNYTNIANLDKSNTIKNYFKDNFNYELTTENYNAIRWIVENMYVPETNESGAVIKESSAEKYREQLWKNIKQGIDLDNGRNDGMDSMTVDDIEVVQQIALWYFTNYDSNGGDKSVSLNTNDLGDAILKINEKKQSDNLTDTFNKKRSAQISALYNYLIDSAKKASETSEEIKEPILELTSESAKIENKKDASRTFLIGPFKISEVEKGNIGLDELNIEVKYKTNYDEEEYKTLDLNQAYVTICDANENRITINKNEYASEFYILIEGNSLGIFNITDVNLKISYKYSYDKTTATLWEINEDGEDPKENQPVLKVEREYKKESKEISKEIHKEKEFDLALRKYITTANGIKLEGSYSREPKINLNELRNGTATTATYEHTKAKDIILRKGDTIVYTIRIYNEGEIDGYATKVTDYLSEGLELVENSQINNKYGWTLGEAKDGKVTVETNYLADKTIKAYNPEIEERNIGAEDLWQQTAEENETDGLYYREVEIECRIKNTAEVGEWLPNIAEITGAKDIDGNEIKNEGEDRDSTPANLEDLRNYQYTYPNSTIEEDDDDYEWVSVGADKVFDLALRKYITTANGIKLEGSYSREPKINLNELRNGTATTATYEHTKAKDIILRKGDTIVYTIRIYNEGEIDGYATKVTDYLSEGLELVENSQINNKYGWTLGEAKDGKVTVETNYLADKVIKAYNPEIEERNIGAEDLWQQTAEENETDGLYYREVEIECRIKNTAEVGEWLPNIAEITGAKDIDGNEIKNEGEDRDSTPANLEGLRNYQYTYPNSTIEEDDDDYEWVSVGADKVFDLALRKYITKVNEKEITESRTPEITQESLNAIDNKTTTTATYNHRKDAIEVETGDLVTYKLTIYNEGETDGRATKLVDQLPVGLEFVEVTSGNYELESYDEETNKVTLRETANNGNLKAKEEGRNLSQTTVEIVCKVTAKVKENDQILTNVAWIAEDYNAENNEITDRDSKPSKTPEVNKNNMENYTGKDNKEDLGDSNNYYKGQEDDDDFEKLIIKGKTFDLALRKYIDNIERKGEGLEITSRVPSIDTSKLNTTNENGKLTTTAKYIHPKNAITVKQGDIITYKLRVYNEGELAGYATQITDYIPEGLGFLMGYSGNDWWKLASEAETQPLVGEKGWYETKEDVPIAGILKDEDLSKITIVTGKKTEVGTENLIITNNSLQEDLIKQYGAEAVDGDNWQQSINNEESGLFYQEVEVTCIVLAPNTWQDNIINIAEISDDKAVDEVGTELEIEDRDSKPNDVDLEDYELKEENSTYQEDDDDYEPIQLKYFDLALRKFITGVNDKTIDTRIPEFYIDEDGNYKYKHDKTPVEVVDKDNVTYTIRVFNEGSIAGFAEEIEDDIPEGLAFLPENEINKEYRWVMYREVKEDEDVGNKNTIEKEGKLYVETENAEEAVIVRTDYLSEENGNIDEETGKNSNLLEFFDKTTMESPDYRDVKLVFKVVQKDIPEENEDGIIINKAHITEDSDDDEDSIPNEWNEGEDDQDKEYVYVQKFDLALFKWVTKTIVTVNGKTTETETGFKPNIGKTEALGDEYRNNDEAEPIASVTIDKKKLTSTVVKFVYNIKVANEGDIEGYATELTDYIPEGLKFVQEDNPLWTLAGDGKITTRALETILLKPGESTTIPVTFTWINDANNLGIKKNIAAITEDYNEKHVADEDSTPANEDIPNYDKEQEDDDDFALVILTLKTGNKMSYIGLIISVITIITAGIITIKKYVLF